MKSILFLFAGGLMFFSNHVNGQSASRQSHVNITLSDSTEVHLFADQDGDVVSSSFYYLPANMRLSYRDSIPEFSFMAYDKNGDGENDGGIMHILLTWGLTKQQLFEAEEKLKIWTDSTAVIMGCSMVENNQFSMDMKTELAEILERSLRSKGSAPVFSGGKMALSYMFSKEDIKRMEQILMDQKILKETIVKFDFDVRPSIYEPILKIPLQVNLFKLIGEINPE